MAEYICREAIIDDLEKEIEAGNVALDEDVWINKGLKIAIRDIKDIKTADVQSIRRGRWENPVSVKNGIMFCSVCRNEAYWDTDYGQQLFDFCPYCGAKMIKDGEQNEVL